MDYRVPLLDSWPDRDMEERPLSIIDVVELSLAYKCNIIQQDMVQYIHINRLDGQCLKLLFLSTFLQGKRSSADECERIRMEQYSN